MLQPIAPESTNELMLILGSRSGGYVAVALFGTAFAVLGMSVAIAIRRSAPLLNGAVAAAIGLTLFAVPFAMTYVSSFGGFYEASISGGAITLHYLRPGDDDVIPVNQLADVRPVPAFRWAWRLQLEMAGGRTLESATGRRDAITLSADRLRAFLARTNGD